VIALRRALGLPEPGPGDRVFGEEDLDAYRALKLFFDSGLPEESITELTRVLGEGMARFAAGVAGAFTAAFLRRGDTEHDVALRFAEMTQSLGPATAPVLVAALNAHLREISRRAMIGRDQLQSGQVAGAQEVVVCFADLVAPRSAARSPPRSWAASPGVSRRWPRR
jgi:adenylate cyclase